MDMPAPRPYDARTAVGHPPPLSGPQFVEPPLSPRVKALAVGVRACFLMAADVLGEFAGLPKREAGVR